MAATAVVRRPTRWADVDRSVKAHFKTGLKKQLETSWVPGAELRWLFVGCRNGALRGVG
ncbi:hypothetical protein G3N59_11650 [Paraburkholderia sp. Ac-20340]|uniref:hypothetical protein n=1 Tax=Paraburkholderia sp. Ac-20340 TaxID=2703888 RepID=UPI00197D963A|nr:hypothetical protein [Paraburkholderia sp. Ac-20340]MBN3854034.1 hypothetical protein [Paraburkholderia sp. Ac-20340]